MGQKSKRSRSKKPFIIAAILLLAALVFANGKLRHKIPFIPAPEFKYDSSVTASDQQKITDAMTAQSLSLSSDVNVAVKLSAENTAPDKNLTALVPVTNLYSPRQSTSLEEIKAKATLSNSVDANLKPSIAEYLGKTAEELTSTDPALPLETSDTILLLPVGELSHDVKLLKLDDIYYLDDFSKGGIFRNAELSGSGLDSVASLKLNDLPTKETTLKANTTGVTALTRRMQKMLARGKTPEYFAEKIGEFAADADITHVSNEVSFLSEGCTYHNAVFCSPPEFIKTLQASGVDLVELTGNHNNDRGSEANTVSINKYHELGMKTFGGGLNAVEAAKPAIFEQKGSKVGYLGYNYPDSPNGGAIAGPNKAGANSFDFDKIKRDIEALKAQVQYIMVHIQFWECYAYPDGFVEYPICDQPITDQESVFKQVADLGADMVVGSSAHQPQTFELYKDKPIYYGLGNMYFEQVEWPGTERGIILTHYFARGKLLNTKLTPTVYGSDLQTRIMTDKETDYLLQRLDNAR